MIYRLPTVPTPNWLQPAGFAGSARTTLQSEIRGVDSEYYCLQENPDLRENLELRENRDLQENPYLRDKV